MKYRILILLVTSVLLTACGTLTGIPSHGGGKRFAVEQELVAASARAAVKNMDLSALQGRKVAIHVSTMGDQGSGTMSGGRYSVDALLRGEYLNNPTSQAQYEYPTYTSTANTVSGALASVTTSSSILNAPSFVRTKNSGTAGRRSMGLNINGIGDYRNETLTANPRDSAFLDNLIQSVFFLRGIDVVSPAYADADIFVSVDVFGTIRSRTELHLYNAETLAAQTKLEYFAVAREDKRLLIRPTVSAYEARYQENYVLWTGPLRTNKNISAVDGLMVDFSDIRPYGSETNSTPQWQSEKAQPSAMVDDEVIRKRREDE